MERGERHLGRARQVEVVLGQRVDLLLGVGEEAGAVERLLAHEHRRDHRLEPLPAEHARAPSARARARASRAGPSGRRSASRPRARPPPCRRGRRAARGGRGPSSPPRRPRAAPRPPRAPTGRAGSAALRARAWSCSSTRVDLALKLLHLAPRRRASPRSRPTRPRRSASPRRSVVGRVLLGAQLLELGQQLAPARVERQQLVERVAPRRGAPARREPAPGRAVSPSGRARPAGLGLLAAAPRRPSTSRGTRPPRRPPRRRRCSRA